MATSNIPVPDKMNTKGERLNDWNYFKASWNNYSIATELNKKSKDVQVGTLLSIIGKDCYEIYENLPLLDNGRKDPDTIVQKLTEYFEPQKKTLYMNVTYLTQVLSILSRR